MCGFVGWVDPKPQTREVLERMTTRISHRGPDAFGYHCNGPIALGHRRLAIIDLEASVQPMRSLDGRYVLGYNGELYNFRELRRELESLGRSFRTVGDTEVLLQALIEWGESAIPRLQGMFAFALWDSAEESLLLARDHLGVKPLHVFWDGNRLLFASEIKALLEHPAVSREIDPNAIGLYLECQYIPAPFTIYRQIRKLPPAHLLSFKKGHLEQFRYWTPTYLPKFDFDEETALERLEVELRRSVASMLISDVPLGVFVSGGLDSSLIAALMQAEGRSPKIFHLGFENPLHSEHEHAARVASFLGVEHHPLIVHANDMIEVLDHWVEVFDEPFGDQAALPTLLLSQLTQSHVKVVLTGEGADEVFAGYSNYAKRLKEAPLSARLRSKYSPVPYLYPFLPAQLRKNRVVKAAGRPLSRRYTTIPNLFDRELHPSILSRELHAAQGVGLETLAEPHYFSCDSNEYLDRMLHIDANLWLADDLLTKVDRATMAYSIEARVPYLDHHLVEFAARLPSHFKMRGSDGKYLLKQLAGKGFLPPEIISRPKRGFVVPLREWMGKELRPMLDETLSPAGLLGRNIFRPGVVERLRREEKSQRRLHATRIWSLLALELWFRRYAPDYRV
jgi:asparagine synthase (glutamine-hydrolysing)